MTTAIKPNQPAGKAAIDLGSYLAVERTPVEVAVDLIRDRADVKPNSLMDKGLIHLPTRRLLAVSRFGSAVMAGQALACTRAELRVSQGTGGPLKAPYEIRGTAFAIVDLRCDRPVPKFLLRHLPTNTIVVLGDRADWLAIMGAALRETCARVLRCVNAEHVRLRMENKTGDVFAKWQRGLAAVAAGSDGP